MSRKLPSSGKDWSQKTERVSSNPESNYQHAPLPNERSFRLLRILSGDQPEVHFTLMDFSLQDPPEYRTLSYTWGRAMCDKDSDGTEQFNDSLCTVICNRGQILITENLNDALLQFRQLDILGYLWVDAICINQEDLSERQSQVSQMGDIYANAKEVVVWLGSDQTDLTDFVRAHEEYYPRLRTEFRKIIKAGKMPNIRSLELPRHFDVSNGEWTRSWRSYARFYRTRRWFRRGWVVQEVALASSLLIYCGDKILDFGKMAHLDHIMRVTGWIESFNSVSNDVDRTCDISSLHVFWKATHALANRSKTTRSAFILWVQLIHGGLHQLRYKDFTLPHDKIYALLGIINKYIPQGRVPPISVDYTLSQASVFSKISEFLILELPNLIFLESINNRPPSPTTGIPSWSSDFRRSFDSDFLTGSPKLTISPPNLRSSYNFSGELHSSVRRPQRQDNCMSFSGRCVDKCISVTTEFFLSGRTSYLKKLFAFCQELNPKFAKTPNDQLETLWRTIVGNKSLFLDAVGMLDYMYPAQERIGDCFNDWMVELLISDNQLSLDGDLEHRWTKIKEDLTDYPLQLPSFQSLLRAIVNQSADITSPAVARKEEFHELVRTMLPGRRVFLTEQGYLGVGADCMQVGDEVWLLETGQLGYILRPVPGEKTYTFVGTAYLHGFMDGQALDIPGFREGIGPVHVV